MAVTSGAGAESTSAKVWTSSVIACSIGTPVYWAGTVLRLCAKKAQCQYNHRRPKNQQRKADQGVDGAVGHFLIYVPVAAMNSKPAKTNV